MCLLHHFPSFFANHKFLEAHTLLKHRIQSWFANKGYNVALPLFLREYSSNSSGSRSNSIESL